MITDVMFSHDNSIKKNKQTSTTNFQLPQYAITPKFKMQLCNKHMQAMTDGKLPADMTLRQTKDFEATAS
jgi:hypothetical protein